MENNLANSSAAELLEKADELLDQAVPEVDLAESLLAEAVKKEPNNTEILDKYGEFCCHYSDPDKALELFKRSVELKPDEGSGKYLYLAQMSGGHEALQYYEKGLQLNSSSASTSDKTRIYVAISELYMTDLCDEDNAQKRCENALQMAFQTDAEDLEVLIALSTYNKTIGEIDKGIEFAKKADTRLKQLEEEALEKQQKNMFNNSNEDGSSPSGHADTEMQIDDEDGNPESDVLAEVQIKLVTTMIDLRLFREAERIVNKLLEEDEEDVQCWYLSALLYISEGKKDKAEESYGAAEELCKKYPQNAEYWSENLQSAKMRLDKLT